MPDWTVEPMRTFRALARHDYEAMTDTAEAAEFPAGQLTHLIDQATAQLRADLAGVGVDLRAPEALYYFVLGAHLHWSNAIAHTASTCASPNECARGFIVHSANASVGFRTALREWINAVPGIEPEPEPVQPPEYRFEFGDDDL